MKKILFSAVILFFSLSFLPVKAADSYEINLSKDALKKGYPISWQGFEMLISPQKSPSDSLQIKLEIVSQYPKKLKTGGKNKISKLYHYTFSGDTSFLPNRATISINSSAPRQKYLYFYSLTKKKWQSIKKYEVDQSEKQVDFLITKPEGYFVILESKTNAQEPAKRLDYTKYGSIDSSVALVLDEKSNKILLKKNINQDVAFDDLTHLLTAWTWQRCCQQDWSKQLIYKSYNDTSDGFPADPDEPYLYQQVFSLLLIGNTYDNFAYTLAENSGGLKATNWEPSTGNYFSVNVKRKVAQELNKNQFLNKMKQEASRLKMDNTVLYDIAGRKSGSKENLTQALDLAYLGKAALRNSTMQWPLKTPYYEFNGITSGHHKIYNTNPLVKYGNHKFDFSIGKTGKNGSAGYGAILIADDNLQENASVLAVVLGHSVSSDQAAREAQKLAEWAFRRWRWVE